MDKIEPSKGIVAIPPVGGRSAPSERERRKNNSAKNEDSAKDNHAPAESDSEMDQVDEELEKSSTPDRKGTQIDIQI